MDVYVYGIAAAAVTEFDVRQFLDVDCRKVVSISIHVGCAIVKFKE